MKSIEQEHSNGVEIWRFAHGKVSALDLEFLSALDAALAAAERAPARAYVWTGTGNAFSAGVDLFRILQGGTAYVEQFLPLLSAVLRRAFAFPHPVVAAVNGHAIAGGCLLVCAADLRLMGAGNGRVGVPELRVGVPFPAIALEMLRFATGGRGVQDVVLGGATWLPDEAVQRGLIDQVVPAADLQATARAAAESLGSIPAAAFALGKQQLRRPVLDQAERFDGEWGAAAMAQWCAPETHAVIRAYLDRTVGKKA